jgi:hypothetical protein
VSLKNDVLTLDEREAASEHLAEGWFHLLRFIKRIGLRIIAFLAQIEGFQKMLWEKQPLVTEVVAPVTVGDIPEMWYAEIAVCAAQWEEVEGAGCHRRAKRCCAAPCCSQRLPHAGAGHAPFPSRRTSPTTCWLRVTIWMR